MKHRAASDAAGGPSAVPHTAADEGVGPSNLGLDPRPGRGRQARCASHNRKRSVASVDSEEVTVHSASVRRVSRGSDLEARPPDILAEASPELIDPPAARQTTNSSEPASSPVAAAAAVTTPFDLSALKRRAQAMVLGDGERPVASGIAAVASEATYGLVRAAPQIPTPLRVCLLLLLDYSRDAGLGASPRPARAARAAWVLGSPRGVSLALRPVASSPSPPSPPPPSPPPPPPDGGDVRAPAPLASPSVNALGRSPSPSARSPLAPLSLVAERARARTALALTARTCRRHSVAAQPAAMRRCGGGVEQRSGDQGGCGGAEAWRASSGCSGGPLTHRRRLRRCCTGHEWLSRSLHGVLKKSVDARVAFAANL